MAFARIEFTKDTCPHCRRVLDIHILHLNSMLGQRESVCAGCKKPIETGRIEWLEMNEAVRRWYVGISFVYAVLVGFLGGYSYLFCVACWDNDPGETKGVPDFLGRPFVTGFALWAVFVLIVQLIRIAASIHRSRRSQLRPVRDVLNLQNGMQFKFLGLLFLTPLIVMFLRRFIWTP